MTFHMFSASERHFPSSLMDEHAHPASIVSSPPHMQDEKIITPKQTELREKKRRESNLPFLNMGGLLSQDAFKPSE